jgi:phytoene dehydrogenase-like protein
VIDSSDKVGGRIQTDYLDGYLLDRGFQVFIEQYPEANELFDYNKLNLNQFLPGAIVRFNKKFHLVSDPFRRPEDLFPSLLTPIGTFFDKAKV